MIQAAQTSVKKIGSFYHAKYWKLRSRLGSANKAKVAIANRLARAIYHILKDKQKYKDLGAHRAEASDDHQIKRLLGKLKAMGVSVNFHYEQKIVEASKSVEVMA